MNRVTEADLFERDLFGTTPRRLQAVLRARARARNSWNRRESVENRGESTDNRGESTDDRGESMELDLEHPQRQPATPPPPPPAGPARGPTPVRGPSVVLKRTLVRLPTLNEEFEVSKILDTSTDTPSTRATNSRGASIDSQQKQAEETRAYLRRHRQIHPALNRAMSRAGNNRVDVLIWLYVSEDLYDKGASRERPPVGGPRVAQAEAMMVEPPIRPVQPPDPRMIAYRRQVDAVVEQAMRELPQATGVQVVGRVGAVPSVIVKATSAQVRRLSARPDVAGLFLYEPRGVLDLDDSMKIARANTAVASGFKGTDIKVAVWEPGPDVLTDLRIEAFFDTAQTDKSNHCRLVTAIIKNRQSGASAPHGYAPDAKVFAANSFDVKALNWAIVTKQCSVINQSFHLPSEETTSGFSAEDLVKDYYATHYPYPTIVTASGNQSTTGVEFVNHKGYNVMVVGNHNDAADRMSTDSVFRNPTSPHSDRELPDVCANGMGVSAAGHSDSGTSFASPAVAGSVAVIQRVAPRLRVWPEGCRALIMAGAGRNVRGKKWWDDVRRREDGRDGAGALDTNESAVIAGAPAARNGAAARRGWDVGTLRSTDFGANGRSTFKYQVEVPASGSSKQVRVALAWSSKVTYVDDSTQTPPIKSVVSTLTTDLDLHLYEGSRLVEWSASFDNSYEIIDFEGQPGKIYDIVIRRWSGTDWVWFGIAWTVF